MYNCFRFGLKLMGLFMCHFLLELFEILDVSDESFLEL